MDFIVLCHLLKFRLFLWFLSPTNVIWYFIIKKTAAYYAINKYQFLPFPFNQLLLSRKLADASSDINTATLHDLHCIFSYTNIQYVYIDHITQLVMFYLIMETVGTNQFYNPYELILFGPCVQTKCLFGHIMTGSNGLAPLFCVKTQLVLI